MTTRRSTLRHLFAETAETQITEFQTVYTAFPEAFSGESPILTVVNAPEKPGMTPTEPGEVFLELGIWVRRDGDPEGAEDLLDTLTNKVCALVLDDFRGGFPVASEPDYVEFDGLSWRVEFLDAKFIRP